MDDVQTHSTMMKMIFWPSGYTSGDAVATKVMMMQSAGVRWYTVDWRATDDPTRCSKQHEYQSKLLTASTADQVNYLLTTNMVDKLTYKRIIHLEYTIIQNQYQILKRNRSSVIIRE